MKIVRVKPTILSAPFGSTDMEFTLREFVDAKDNQLDIEDFGNEFVVVVLNQGDTSEMVKCSGFEYNDDDSCTFTVAANGRHIDAKYPYTGHSEGEDFQATAEAIITNDPLTMSQYISREEEVEFDQVPSTAGGDPTGPNDLARKAYVDAAVLGTLTTIDVVVPGKAGTTIEAGDLIYFDATSNRWELCDADTAATVDEVLLGIAQGAGVDGDPITGGVLLQGMDTHQTGMTEGDTYYAGNTAGAISNTPGTTSVPIGIGGQAATDLYFAPRFNIVLTKREKDALAGNGEEEPSGTNRFITEKGIHDVIAAFGDGSDGDVVISSPTSLTRDMYYNNLTVNSVLTTNGWRIFVKDTIDGNGTIQFPDGNAGANAASLNAGAGGAAYTSGYFANTPGNDGGGGAAGGTPGAGGAGESPVAVLGALAGAAGGASGEGDRPGGAGGTSVKDPNLTKVFSQTILGLYLLAAGMGKVKPQPGAGGGGGGQRHDGSSGSGGGGGGGGASGGIVMIVARTWAGTFTIKAIGGNGGNGGAGDVNENTGGGGGAGGNGGVALVIYHTKTWTGAYTLTGGTGGTGGAGGSGGGQAGSSGTNGTVGTSYELEIVDLIR